MSSSGRPSRLSFFPRLSTGCSVSTKTPAPLLFYLPVSAATPLALNWSTLGEPLGERLARRRSFAFRVAFATWLLLLAAPLYREALTFRSLQFSNVKSIAQALARLPQQGTLLVSEAGFLPYYSGWTTYDAWGLNTPEFAHRFFRRADVARIGADLIFVHPDLSESCLVQPGWLSDYPDRTWPHMTRNVILGAADTGYDLWLTSYGSEFYRARKHWRYGEGDRECWLVRLGSPLHSEIELILSAHHGVPPAEALVLEKEHGPLAS